MFLFKTYTLQDLVDRYHNPEEIYGYCTSCENFKMNHSCPPHASNPLDTFPKDAYVSVCVLKRFYSDDQDLSHEYLIERNSLDRAIRDFESISNSVALIPGRCLMCQPCAKALNQPCTDPDQLRFSLETLGFKLSDMLTDLFDMQLTWDKTQLTLIFGFIHASDSLDGLESHLLKYGIL